MEELTYCSSKTIIFEDDFIPTHKPHKGCKYNKVMFAGSELDEENDKIKVFVHLVCPYCGKVKEDCSYFKYVQNTEENRKLYVN